MPHVVILGGGISGLSLAWFLRQGALKMKKKLRISVVESSNRTGGWICTKRVDGHILERGPRGFRPRGNGIETLKLIESLGLQGSTVAPSTTSSNRFVYHENQLQPLPTSIKEIFLNPPPVMEGVIKAVIKEPFKPKNVELKDESIYDFISRRFSKRMATTLIDAMISGIYSGDIKKLSIRSCAPLNKLWEYEQLHGSIVKGIISPLMFPSKGSDISDDTKVSSNFVKKFQKAPQVSFLNGMEHLTETLTKKLAATDDTIIYTGYECIRMDVDSNNNQEVAKVCLLDSSSDTKSDKNDTKVIDNVDHVFSTIPASKLSNILPPSPPFHYAKKLLSKMLHNVNVAVVNLVYNKSNLVGKDGFGYLVPSMEKEGILGVAWDSSIFPGQIDPQTLKDDDLQRFNNTSRLTVMLGGAKDPDIINKSNKELTDTAIKSVTRHLKIGTNDAASSLPDIRVAGIMHDCIPQYYVGHFENVQKLEANLKTNLPQLTFIGTSFYGVGVADCVANSKKAAESYVAKTFF